MWKMVWGSSPAEQRSDLHKRLLHKIRFKHDIFDAYASTQVTRSSPRDYDVYAFILRLIQDVIAPCAKVGNEEWALLSIE